MTVASDLEHRITGAFNERAGSLPSGAGLAPMSRSSEQPARRPTRVLAVGLVMLLVISGTGVLIAVRRSGGNGSVESGGSGAARYRSSVILRFAPEAVSASVPPAGAAEREVADPLKLALAHGLRSLALKDSQVDPAGAPVEFAASENTKRSLITLVVTAPTGALATSVVRSWTRELSAAARVNRRRLLLGQERAVGRQLTTLNRELATIDADLARLLPKIYGNVLQYDEPNGLASTGSKPSMPPPSPRDLNYGPPPVPEQGTPHALNLAFERIQLLSARTKAVTKQKTLRFVLLAPSSIQVVSVSPARRIEASKK